MAPADPLRFRGPGNCPKPLWLQSMIGHRQGAIEMAEAVEIDLMTTTLEVR